MWLIDTGGVDEEGVGGLSGVDERDRREIGDRERDLDEPDDEEFDDADEEDGDRLGGALFLWILGGGGGGGDEAEPRPAFARSGRGAGR